jgi:hypothetical protein
MSSCIRCLSSSDHAAPGFWLSLLCGRGGEVFASRGDFRVPGLSFRVNRETEGIAEELWLMGLVRNSQVGLTVSILAEMARWHLGGSHRPHRRNHRARIVAIPLCLFRTARLFERFARNRVNGVIDADEFAGFHWIGDAAHLRSAMWAPIASASVLCFFRVSPWIWVVSFMGV